jgi:hypothetical protein
MSIVRSTDNRNVVIDTLHWLWSLQLQIGRLAESTRLEWSGPFDTSTNPQRLFSRTSLDEHLVLVVGRNLIRALAQLRKEHPDIGLGNDIESVIPLLRNVYEHWDENAPSFDSASKAKSRGIHALNKIHPDAKPWSITYGSDGPVIGGVVALNDLVVQLDALECVLLKLEKHSRPMRKRVG